MAAGSRVENLESCTSGIPVKVAKKPRAVPNVGGKTPVKKYPAIA